MTRAELEARLIAEGVPPQSYCLVGGHPNERYTLRAPYKLHPEEHEGVAIDPLYRDHWAVYYSERGKESGRRSFETEAEACAFFAQLILSDPTVQAEP